MNQHPFTFNEKTPQQVRAAIQSLYENGHRARFFYGDPETGRDWMEENDTIGRVGKSTGWKPIPLVIHNARSTGGPGLLDGCLVKIVDLKTARVLYQHPQYHQPVVTVGPSDDPKLPAAVFFDGQENARCKSTEQAERLAAFWRGERNAK